MSNFENSYINILASFIRYFHQGLDKVDPVRINKAKFYARTLYIAYCYAIPKLSKEKSNSLHDVCAYLDNRFTQKNLFSKIIRLADDDLVSAFDANEIAVPSIPLSSLYENLLNIETLGTEIRLGKEYRNKLGSYYTPLDYAQEITKRTLQQYYSQNIKKAIFNARIVDFSCGGGVFLISLLSILLSEGYSAKDIRKIIRNLYAFDVDPIALEIAKISILDYANASDLYEEICDNFHHGNFLLHTYTEKDEVLKLEASMKGFIYHEDLAIGVNYLQEYDIILGNPPWEKIRLEEKKFYSQYSQKIEFVNFRFELSNSIEEAQRKNEFIRDYANEYKKQLEKAKKTIKKSEFFSDSTFGELNTCSLFADASNKLLSPKGAAGIFVKSALVTAKVNSVLFNKTQNKIISIFDFINTAKIFEIDSRERFSIVILGKKSLPKMINLGMNLVSLEDIDKFSENVSVELFEQFNPETKMVPNLSSNVDVKILSGIYQKFDIFSKNYSSVKYGRLVHLTNHVKDIQKKSDSTHIPVFEGKFFSNFDNAYSGFNEVPFEDRYKPKAASKRISDGDKTKGVKPLCRFYISKQKWAELSKGFDANYMLAWHSLTSATNVRSCVASLLPFIPGSQSIQFLVCPNNNQLIYLSGIFNSVVFDYIVKCKLTGIDLTQAVINQIPVPTEDLALKTPIRYKEVTTNTYSLIRSIVKCIYNNDSDVAGLFIDNGKEEMNLHDLTRKELFMLLDATVAALYNVGEMDLNYILSKFKMFYSDIEAQAITSMLPMIKR